MVIKTLLEEEKNISIIFNNVKSLTTLIYSAIKSNEKDTRKNLFQEAVKIACGIEYSPYRSRALNEIMKSVSILDDVELKKNLFPMLVEVARGIEDSTYRRSALRSIGESASKLGIDLDVAE
jgi:hypothetical protein